MVKSMTGYGRARKTLSNRDITVEVRSVNNRYLDCTVKQMCIRDSSSVRSTPSPPASSTSPARAASSTLPWALTSPRAARADVYKRQVKKGQTLGELVIRCNGTEVGRVALGSAGNVEAPAKQAQKETKKTPLAERLWDFFAA